MDHIESVRKWPAAYKLMAMIMDDVSIDREKAEQIWTKEAVKVSLEFHSSAIGHNEVTTLVHAVVSALNVTLVNATIGEPKPAPVTTPTPASAPASRSGSSYRSGSKKKAPVLVRGAVASLDEETREARYGGGIRHTVTVLPEGKAHTIKGTLPRSHIGKLKVGDKVEFEAQVWEFNNRNGWFKYPKNLETT